MDDHTVVGRTLDIISAVADQDGAPISLAVLTTRTAIPKPTVRRIADDLARRGLLVRSAAGYLIGPAAEEFSRRVLAADHERALASPALVDLHSTVAGGAAWLVDSTAAGEFPMVSLIAGRAVLESGPLSWPSNLRHPGVLATALAPVALASRPEVAERLLRTRPARLTPRSPSNAAWVRTELRRVADEGYAVEHEQVRLGWTCVALPVEGTDRVLGVVTPVHGFRRTQVLGAARSTAAYLSSLRPRPSFRTASQE